MSDGHDAAEMVKRMDEEIEAEENAALGITEQIERDVTREPDELSKSVEPEEEVEQEEVEQEVIVEEQETDVTTAEAETVSSEDDEEEAEPEKPQRRSWKNDYHQMEKRFNNYKGSTDSTIYSLRQELASAKEQLNEAITAFGELQKRKDC
jgi:hypothetical protein